MIISKYTLLTEYTPAVMGTEYDVPLMTLTITTVHNEKVYIDANLNTRSAATVGLSAFVYYLYVDGVVVNIGYEYDPSASGSYAKRHTQNLLYVTDALSAGTHVIKIAMKWSAGIQASLTISSGYGSPSFLQVIQYR
jgi:hypothetical protein